jgi:hypothetical protein
METFIKILGLFVIVVILSAWPTQLLWNWLMPTIFGLCKITFWQALGLNCLVGLFFRTNNTSRK